MIANWVFVGNPGTGKSTLLNCLAGQRVFPSGVSYGGGLTKTTKTFADPNKSVIYTDTPGLADRKTEQAAAQAITCALRTGGGYYKLCFVIRLENGRVVSEDLVTMERVLDSIRMRDVPFGIIVNNVSPVSYKLLSAQLTEFQRIVTLINSGKYKTPYLLVIPRFHELFDTDNQVIDLPSVVRQSIEGFPTALIPPHVVTDIVDSGFGTSLERVNDKILYYVTNQTALDDERLALEKNRPGFWAIAVKAMLVIGQIAVHALVFA